jgi:hypothetical protein
MEGVTHLACSPGEKDKERTFPTRSRKVGYPVGEKGVDRGEIATQFYFSFSKDQKEER